jgi:predicted PurR-regulated permease PerM
LLTTALASLFEGSLALLEHLFLAHIELESGVTIFVSALVVAILFAPLRRRLEAFLSHNDRSPSRVANER